MGKEVRSGEFRWRDPQDSAYTEFWTASSSKIWGVLLQRSLGAAHRMMGPASSRCLTSVCTTASVPQGWSAVAKRASSSACGRSQLRWADAPRTVSAAWAPCSTSAPRTRTARAASGAAWVPAAGTAETLSEANSGLGSITRNLGMGFPAGRYEDGRGLGPSNPDRSPSASGNSNLNKLCSRRIFQTPICSQCSPYLQNSIMIFCVLPVLLLT